jgi:hypothetical protein
MSNQTQQLTKIENIENAIDREQAGALSVNSNQGGLSFSNMAEVLEFAKLMAVSGEAVPKHCRPSSGGCRRTRWPTSRTS